jgi:tetratricopeptide (TPR) repeat protein
MPSKERPMPRKAPFLSALCAVLTLAPAPPATAQAPGEGLAGPYLAARAAVMAGDHRAASIYFENAIAADPGNTQLVGNAIYANAALGQWGRAADIADMLPADAETARDLINLVRFVQGLNAGDLVGARAAIEAGEGAGPFIDDLALGWIYFGEGDLGRAAAQFEQVAETAGLADLAYTQLGLARAAAGDFEGANALFSGEEAGGLSVTERSIRARAEILVQLEQTDAALELLDFFIGELPDPAFLTLRNRIAAADGPGAYDFVTTPQEGIAEVFFTVARALAADGGSTSLPLLYARAAHGIDPGHAEAVIFAGQILAQDGQHELAADAYSEVRAGDDQYVEAQLGRADAYFALGRERRAVEVLQELADAYPDFATIHASLGDVLRRSGDCAGAVESYGRALDLVDTTQERFWFLHYARGNCYGDLGDYEAAEADYRQALVLNPDQPQVLNNLGYSLVERRINLDEALDMIERAVEGDPESGYIVDSLAWVLYRLGRFEEAVAPMERAAALLPNDPIVNDHLGDVYWMVGRYREAEFQWHRALSFEPAEDDAARIRRKLDVGLYEVLESEGGVGETQ